jgi:hypothetical protein
VLAGVGWGGHSRGGPGSGTAREAPARVEGGLGSGMAVEAPARAERVGHGRGGPGSGSSVSS